MSLEYKFVMDQDLETHLDLARKISKQLMDKRVIELAEMYERLIVMRDRFIVNKGLWKEFIENNYKYDPYINNDKKES